MLLTDPVFWGILVFGIWTSYTDIRRGKIKNLSIILLLISGLLINLIWTKSLIESPLRVILNSGIALLVGYIMWEFGFWSPADAKLFFAFSFLLPITIYNRGRIPYFPSYTILINTFVPVALFFLLYSLVKIRSNFIKGEIKELLKLSSLLNMILFILGFSSFFIILNSLINFKIKLFFQIVLMFIISEIIKKRKRSFLIKINVFMIVLGIITNFESIFSLNFLKKFFLTFFLFQGLRLLILNIEKISLTQELKIEDLKPDMIIGENIIKKNGTYSKDSISIITHFDILRNIRKKISAKFSGKLDENDVKKLKKLKKEDKLKFNTVKISKTTSFAPFIFLGMILTYLLKGSISSNLIIVVEYIKMYLIVIYYKLTLILGLI